MPTTRSSSSCAFFIALGLRTIAKKNIFKIDLVCAHGQRGNGRPCILSRHTVSTAAIANDQKRGYGCKDLLSRPTTKHGTCDISYDSFVKTCLLATLQTRQTVGHYGLRNSLTGLAVTLGLRTRSGVGILCRQTFMAFLTYSKGPLTDILNFSRVSLASVLNPVPGNQSGMYRTIERFAK